MWPAALGTGIDIPGTTHVVHREAPHGIIDYAQEAGRAGRAGEETIAEIVVEEKDWPADDATTDRFVELKRREVNSLIRTQGCRRRVLGQCLDGDPRQTLHINNIYFRRSANQNSAEFGVVNNTIKILISPSFSFLFILTLHLPSQFLCTSCNCNINTSSAIPSVSYSTPMELAIYQCSRTRKCIEEHWLYLLNLDLEYYICSCG